MSPQLQSNAPNPSKPEPAGTTEEPAQESPESTEKQLPPLPTPVRIFLYFLGWLLLLVGLLGLFLPGIQGILTMVLGAAILSLASEATHRWLRSLLRRWPAGHRRMERLRARLHHMLSRTKK